jgi:hypothetical protein
MVTNVPASPVNAPTWTHHIHYNPHQCPAAGLTIIKGLKAAFGPSFQPCYKKTGELFEGDPLFSAFYSNITQKHVQLNLHMLMAELTSAAAAAAAGGGVQQVSAVALLQCVRSRVWHSSSSQLTVARRALAKHLVVKANPELAADTAAAAAAAAVQVNPDPEAYTAAFAQAGGLQVWRKGCPLLRTQSLHCTYLVAQGLSVCGSSSSRLMQASQGATSLDLQQCCPCVAQDTDASCAVLCCAVLCCAVSPGMVIKSALKASFGPDHQPCYRKVADVFADDPAWTTLPPGKPLAQYRVQLNLPLLLQETAAAAAAAAVAAAANGPQANGSSSSSRQGVKDTGVFVPVAAAAGTVCQGSAATGTSSRGQAAASPVVSSSSKLSITASPASSAAAAEAALAAIKAAATSLMPPLIRSPAAARLTESPAAPSAAAAAASVEDTAAVLTAAAAAGGGGVETQEQAAAAVVSPTPAAAAAAATGSFLPPWLQLSRANAAAAKQQQQQQQQHLGLEPTSLGAAAADQGLSISSNGPVAAGNMEQLQQQQQQQHQQTLVGDTRALAADGMHDNAVPLQYQLVLSNAVPGWYTASYLPWVSNTACHSTAADKAPSHSSSAAASPAPAGSSSAGSSSPVGKAAGHAAVGWDSPRVSPVWEADAVNLSAAAEDEGHTTQDGNSQGTAAAAAEAEAAEVEGMEAGSSVALEEVVADISASDEQAAVQRCLQEAKGITVECKADLLLSGTSRALNQDSKGDSKSAAAAVAPAAADTAEGVSEEQQQQPAAAAEAGLSEDMMALLQAVSNRYVAVGLGSCCDRQSARVLALART